MPSVLVGPVSQFDVSPRRVMSLDDDLEVVILNVEGRYYAFENRCLHMGGPLAEGRIMKRVEAELDEDGYFVKERFSDVLHLICPWHGWEYELETGNVAADPCLAARTFPVTERDGELFVRIDQGGQ